MDSLGPAHSRGQTRWPSAHDQHARGGQCHLLRAARRLPVADAPERVSAPPDRLPLLPDLALCRRVGADARHPAWGSARGFGPYAGAQCGDHRQSDGKDHRKRGVRGYDGGKRIRGRKRHIVVDVLGLLLVVMVHSAGIQDRDGAKSVLRALVARFPGLQLIWADGGYAGKLVTWVATVRQRTLVIVKRPRHTRGFQVVQWRWIVERTFGWLNRSRRLSKDFEALPETTETWMRIAMIQLMVRRLAARA
jgi:transposase